MQVIVDGDLDRTLRLFRKKIEVDGIIRLVREKGFRGYESPGQARRRKEHEAYLRRKKEMRRRERRR
jgi:small subunit ribosomal protein S21